MYDELVATLRRQCVEMACGNCNTCVNRQAADAIEEIQGKFFLMKKTAEWLAEKVPKWIPVTERLPEEPGEYIVFIRDPFYGKDEPQDEFNVDASYATSCFYDKDAGLWREGEDNYYCANLQCVNTAKMYYITHWMPLPSTEGLNET